METKVHPAKTNSGYQFIHLEVYNSQGQMNKQSGFNVEQIEEIIIQRGKPFEDQI
jgi:hypothetical protein